MTSTAIASDPPRDRRRSASRPKQGLPALMLGAIGVVFGDIGTSPLYALKESFVGPHPLAVDRPHIFGVLSLIFWTLMLVVTVKYVLLAMRAHNRGEGGSFALLALISRKLEGDEVDSGPGHARRARDRALLRRRDHHPGNLRALGGRGPDRRRGAAGAAGAADLDRRSSSACSSSRRAARRRVGRDLRARSSWSISLCLAGSGIINIVRAPGHPGHPQPALGSHISSSLDPELAFLALGSVVLAVTGAETLYADMGHFGRKRDRLCLALARLSRA